MKSPSLETPDDAQAEQTSASEANPTRPAPEESFESLLKASGAGPIGSDLQIGQKVEGVIVKFDDSMAFLDVGRKGEAVLSLEELRGPDGTVTSGLGDRLMAYVAATHAGVVLTLGMARGPTPRSMVEDAASSGMPVEGLVTDVNKGGLEVDIGGTRAFCPMSQIDLHFCENPAVYIGQRHRFRVTQYTEGGRKVVVSRRAILEEEAAKVASELRKELRPGAVLRGRVVNLREFGAFVDLGGGIEGLIHVSEMSHGHTAHAKDVLQVGQEVEVAVLRVEAPREAPEVGDKKRRRPPSERIALSLKTLAQDPWQTAKASFPEGSVVTGKVVRLQPFGAFVELAPGVDGLLHVSNMVADRKINHPKDVLTEGQTVEATVLAVDEERKRIGLTLLTGDARERRKEAASKPAAGGAVRVGQIVEGEVDRIEPFGVFLRLDGGGRGLVPNAEIGTPKGTDHKKMFPIGTRMRAAVLEHDSSTGRIRLSKKGAEDAAERAEYEGYVQKQPNKGGFGTFGDLLKPRR